ncbi:hypothetical protein BV898_15739 [Hypsibius exemplaris]|uniref:Integrase p58-like C-terminal domain-containing protein n=1 Tax=Hypsibius exemplaris TaxID=2072580 RepID=A0A9X6RKT3_HYPEX|nr:hypothetical protein BV898_15739 [Hypsibius exemplaris]
MRVIAQTSPVNYLIKTLSGRQKPYMVHVERLKFFHEREEESGDEKDVTLPEAVTDEGELYEKSGVKKESDQPPDRQLRPQEQSDNEDFDCIPAVPRPN